MSEGGDGATGDEGGGLYDQRWQTQAKHDLLRAYLEPFAFKVLQVYGSLDFVDGFAGPWKSRDEAGFRDTSFGIAVDVLDGVMRRLTEMDRPVRIRCVFNELDPAAFARLEGYVVEAQLRHPGLELHALQGEFAANALRIDELCRHAFRLVYVDPTGWTGYPRDALRQVVPRGRRAEVMINFMSAFARRFLVSPADRRERWLDEMLGPERAARLRGQQAAEETIRRAVAGVLREELGLSYVCETPIAASDARSVHFWMLYGTRSAAGVEVLRDAEVRALTRHETARDARRAGDQASLMELPAAGPYSAMREEHLRTLQGQLVDALARIGPITFGKLAARVMARRHLRKIEVKDAVARLAEAGRVEPSWRTRNPRTHGPGNDDMITLVD